MRNAARIASFNSRSSSLDGVKGLAALTVVVLHFVSTFHDTQFAQYAWVDRALGVLAYTPISALWAGSSAVALFFILSGYALHRMFSVATLTYAGYAVRRIIRLWLPYVATLAVAAISISLIGSHKIAGQSDWLNSLLGSSLSASMVFEHLLMVGDFDTKPIDFVVWSLVIEMRISLVFPLIFWAVECSRPIATLVASVLIGAVSILAQHRFGSSSVSMIATFGYQPFFVIGALMSKYESQIERQYVQIPAVGQAGLFLIALTFYCGGLRISATYSTMLGASWIIVVALCSSDARRVLDNPLIQRLGRISYSLYLCHAVVLLSFINFCYPRLPFSIIALVSLPAIIISSALLYRFVEQPAIALSRIVGRPFILSRPTI